jgi:hypothetical protein
MATRQHKRYCRVAPVELLDLAERYACCGVVVKAKFMRNPPIWWVMPAVLSPDCEAGVQPLV